MPTCRGFEYYVKQEAEGEEGISHKWQEGDCTP